VYDVLASHLPVYDPSPWDTFDIATPEILLYLLSINEIRALEESDLLPTMSFHTNDVQLTEDGNLNPVFFCIRGGNPI
jgi:hypothetical protein